MDEKNLKKAIAAPSFGDLCIGFDKKLDEILSQEALALQMPRDSLDNDPSYIMAFFRLGKGLKILDDLLRKSKPYKTRNSESWTDEDEANHLKEITEENLDQYFRKVRDMQKKFISAVVGYDELFPGFLDSDIKDFICASLEKISKPSNREETGPSDRDGLKRQEKRITEENNL